MNEQLKSIGAKRAPNQLAGTVVATETHTDYAAGTIYSRMSVAWERGGEHEFRALSHAEAQAIIQAEQQAQVVDTAFAQIMQPVAHNERQLSLL